MFDMTRLYISWTSWGYGTDCQYLLDFHIWGLEDTCTNVIIYCMSEKSMAGDITQKNLPIGQLMEHAITLLMTPLVAKEPLWVATCLPQLHYMG